MPEENVRFVVLGAPKADKEFSGFSRKRKDGLKNLRQLQNQLRRTQREIARAKRKLNTPARGRLRLRQPFRFG